MHRWPQALALLACAVAVGERALQERQDREPADAEPAIELSAGPAHRAAAALAPTTRAAKLDWSSLPLSPNDARLDQPAAWIAWANSVRDEAAHPRADAARSAKLALFARLQGRNDDAWEHFAALEQSPETTAALLPIFLPGIAPELVARGLESEGGVPKKLADGALWTPAPPPPSGPAAQVRLGYAQIERKTMRMSGIGIGSALVSIAISLESDGVQIDLVHQSGGAATVNVLLPELPDFEIYVEYSDWVKLDLLRQPIPVALTPGGETRTLFGRYRPRRLPWPVEPPERLSRALAADGLCFVIDAQSPLAPRVKAMAEGLHALLDIPLRVAAPREATLAKSAAIRVDLGDSENAAAKALSIVSLAERWALAHGSDARR